ncbi:MAG: hypothetical protein J5I50_08550 [Chitinophagaceae bacterium]|nr:hypothetical protein [Chitinophagaceae bacterium]
MPNENKYDFIKDLLQDKRLSQNQRERLYLLIGKELDIEGSLEERVKKIEKVLNIHIADQPPIEPPNEEESQEPEPEEKLPSYIYPSNLYKFLRDYNQDLILKYTCHLIDQDALKEINISCGTETYYDFKLYYKKIVENFKQIEEKYKYAPYQIKALIRGYLTGKDHKGEKIPYWGSENIAFNWANEEVINDWVVHNNNCPPNPIDGLKKNFTDKSNLSIGKVIKSKVIPKNGKYENEYRIRTFSDLVLYFKCLFHIRDDNSLHNILLFQNNQNKWVDKVDFIINEEIFPKNIEFFTDVDKLIQAYNIIIRLIIEVSQNQKPKVELKLKEQNDGIELSIYHKNSKYKKTLQNTLERIGSTYTNLIRNQINGLCDFYVRADFGDGNYAKVSIWDKDFVKNGPRRRKVVEKYESFEGVEHILVFKKK